jgi:5-methylcytosine-specific restriction endonuclease McrA
MAQSRDNPFSLLQWLIQFFSGEQINYAAQHQIQQNDKLKEENLLEEIKNNRVNYSDLDSISSLKLGKVHLHGMFKLITTRYTRNGLRLTQAIFYDETGEIPTIWFITNVSRFINPFTIYDLRGTFRLRNRRLQLVSPEFHILSEGCFSARTQNVVSKHKVIPTLSEVDNFNRHIEWVLKSNGKRINTWTGLINGKPLNKNSSWYKLSQKVLERDKFTCVLCGVSGMNLTVDHIKELSIGGNNELSNLRTLCKDCHEERHLRRFLEKGFDANDNYGYDYKLSKKIAALDDALRNNKSLSISYTDRYKVRSYRIIHPKKMYKGYRGYNKNQVYVDAYCELDQDGRTFRVSRMKLSKTGRSEYLDEPVYK